MKIYVPKLCRWTIFLFLVLSTTAIAQRTVSYHFGIVHPLLWRSDGTLNTVFQETSIALPIGVTCGLNQYFFYDFEVVPVTDTREISNIVFQQGLGYRIRDDVITDIKTKVELTGREAYGFNISLNKVFLFPINSDTNMFAVLAGALPFRFGGKVKKGDMLNPALVVQVGVSF